MVRHDSTQCPAAIRTLLEHVSDARTLSSNAKRKDFQSYHQLMVRGSRVQIRLICVPTGSTRASHKTSLEA